MHYEIARVKLRKLLKRLTSTIFSKKARNTDRGILGEIASLSLTAPLPLAEAAITQGDFFDGNMVRRMIRMILLVAAVIVAAAIASAAAWGRRCSCCCCCCCCCCLLLLLMWRCLGPSSSSRWCCCCTVYSAAAVAAVSSCGDSRRRQRNRERRERHRPCNSCLCCVSVCLFISGADVDGGYAANFLRSGRHLCVSVYREAAAEKRHRGRDRWNHCL